MIAAMLGKSVVAGIAVLTCGILPARAQEARAWSKVSAPHFVIHTDAGAARGQEIARQFEAIRAAYWSAFPGATRDPEEPVTVLATADAGLFESLLPIEWTRDTVRRPPGLMLRSGDRLFVLMRADLRGAQAQQIIHHEYFHIFESRNLPRLPLWLSEGLAEFYANTAAPPGSFVSGAGALQNKLLLRTAKLLSLRELLAVERDSPIYTGRASAQLFYAQAWALVHYLLLGGERPGAIDALVQRSRAGAGAAELHRALLGDLPGLEQRVAAYIRRAEYPSLELLRSPASAPTAFTQAGMTKLEAESAQAALLIAAGRAPAARRVLMRVAADAPQLAHPHELLGELLYREGDEAAAKAELALAGAAGSANWRTHHLLGLLLLRSVREPEGLIEVERHFQRAHDLGPRSVAASASLAWIWMERGRNLTEALALARRVTEQEPRDATYALLLARMLRKLGDDAEAGAVATNALALAQGKERGEVESFLRGDVLAVPDPRPSRGIPVREVIVMEKDPAAEEALRRWRAQRDEVAHVQTFVEGHILNAGCAPKPRLHLEMETASGILKLRAANLGLVPYYVAKSRPPRDFDPCRDLRGKSVEVVYRPSPKGASAGEILAIEMRD